MLCKIYPKVIFSTLLSVFFSALLFSPSYAISDRTVTYNSGSTITNWQDIFPDCDCTCLSQYSYFSISIDSFNHSMNPDIRFTLDSSYSSSFIYRSFSPFYIVSVPFSGSTCYLRFSNSPTDTFSNSITFTLMESYASLPSGNLDITQNGDYDVSNYASVNVNVPATVVEGDYHDDLIKINNSILICGAIMLVLYFFYCIYRMIIKQTGGH